MVASPLSFHLERCVYQLSSASSVERACKEVASQNEDKEPKYLDFPVSPLSSVFPDILLIDTSLECNDVERSFSISNYTLIQN